VKKLGRFLTLLVLLLGMTAIPAGATASVDSPVAASGGSGGQPPVILDSGGPDAYGYYYYDSEDNAFNAPAYNWRDISGIGTDMNIIGDDENVGPFAIGFTFNFYGVDFITFRACSNGFVSLSSADNEHINAPIPTADAPNDLLAVFWDDLHPQTTGHAYYYSNNDTLIIAWHDFGRWSGEGSYTFEIILTADGNILYQYQSVSGVLDSHTIGIEDATGAIGLQYIYNTSRDESGTAILFSLDPPDYGAKDILVIAADEASLFLSDIAGYDDIGTVDYYDGRNGTPSLSLLEEYDGVVVWSNYVFYDIVAIGDVLADYLDAGGAVVMSHFSFGAAWNIAGRIMSEYSPFATGPAHYEIRTLGESDIGHQIMYGIEGLTEYFTADVTLQNSPIVVASYTDGTPLVAYNPINNLVTINCYVGDYRQFTGDVIDLFHNAVIFATDGPAEVLLVEGGTGSTMPKAELRGFGDIQSLHVYNGSISTPSLDLLGLYDAVVVWSDFPYDNAQTMGNRLADYVDLGGGVVLMQFSFGDGWQLEGRIMNSYSPFGVATTLYEWKNLGWFNPDHPLMAGVATVTELFMADVTIENDGEVVASWDDSTPFVAYNPDHDVVAINGYIGDARQFIGDMMLITHNAINFVRGMTGIEDGAANLPNQFWLDQNFPNPFNPTTVVEFNLPTKSDVSLDMFNVLGQKVMTLAPGKLEAGRHALTIDASAISSGVYFYKLTAGEYTSTRKMTVLK